MKNKNPQLLMIPTNASDAIGSFYFKLEVNEKKRIARQDKRTSLNHVASLTSLAHNESIVYDFGDFLIDHFRLSNDKIESYKLECYYKDRLSKNNMVFHYWSKVFKKNYFPSKRKELCETTPISTKNRFKILFELNQDL